MSDDDLTYAREVLATEATAIRAVEERLGDSFLKALELVTGCEGQIVVTGVGKSGIVGQKISATLASTGMPSFHVHAAEAVHGDLGRIRAKDVVIALSFSGETEEVVRLIPLLRRMGTPLIALTGSPESRLGREADVVLSLGPVVEACPMGLAPTSSTTASMALGDALALAASRRKHFSREEYALFHRGGALGRKLLRVGEILRTGEDLPAVTAKTTVRETLGHVSGPEGRTSAALVLDDAGALVGIFTDGDLRRHIQRDAAFLDGPIDAVMIENPKTLTVDTLVADAQKLMKEYRIDEVPVVDAAGRPIGVLDVQDLLEVGFAL
ncbi:MAG: KpsF/GutQ family sugar-phosphate isomerase [Planctomycetota bacterium]